MHYLTTALLAASLALCSLPASALHNQGTDIEASTRLTMNECLAMQAAKHDGARRDEMKKACRWTADEIGTNHLSSTGRPGGLDPAPYGLRPSAPNPPS